MAGGLMQLVAYGAQDIYLTGNPQITFFKSIYRRHTNFSMELIEHQFKGGTPDFGNSVYAQFTKDGDLLTKMYIRIVINSVDPDNTNFAWIRRLGHAILSNIELKIGGTKIDRQSGVWLDIWYELARQGDHETGYAKMIGDVSEMTSYNTEVKEEFVLFVPLQFWFNRHSGLSIPIIALQYHDVELHVEFAPKKEVMIHDCNFDITNPDIKIKEASVLTNYVYLDTEERRRFAQVGHEYLIDQIQFNGTEKVVDLIKNYILDYNHPTKEIIWCMRHGNYITGKSFLYYTNNDSWTALDENNSSALLEAAQKIISESISFDVNPTNTVGGTWYEVIGLSKGTIGTINITNNANESVFVNPSSITIDDYGITDKVYGDVIVNSDSTMEYNNVKTDLTVRDLSFPVEEMTDTRVIKCDPIVYQFSNYGILIDGSFNPVQFAKMKLNGHDRFDTREGIYFNVVQPDAHHTNLPKPGINLYSFSLHPEQHQPSGTANLSRIDDTVLKIWFSDISFAVGQPEFNFLNDDNKLYIYAVNYNILRVLSGMAGIAYSLA